MTAKKIVNLDQHTYEKLKRRISISYQRQFRGKIGNAEDCIGFAFESMLKNPGQTVDHAVIDYVRAETKARPDSNERIAANRLSFYFAQSLDSGPNKELVADKTKSSELAIIIKRLSTLVPDRIDRSIFVLYWKWGLTLKEIAEVMGFSEARVHQRLKKLHLSLSSIVKR